MSSRTFHLLVLRTTRHGSPFRALASTGRTGFGLSLTVTSSSGPSLMTRSQATTIQTRELQTFCYFFTLASKLILIPQAYFIRPPPADCLTRQMLAVQSMTSLRSLGTAPPTRGRAMASKQSSAQASKWHTGPRYGTETKP